MDINIKEVVTKEMTAKIGGVNLRAHLISNITSLRVSLGDKVIECSPDQAACYAQFFQHVARAGGYSPTRSTTEQS